MLDLNTIITQALTTIVTNAVNEQTKPLVERIEDMQSWAEENAARTAVLEQRLTDTENKLTNTRALLLELSNRMAEMTQAQGEQTTPTGVDAGYIKDLVNDAVNTAMEAHLENAPHHDEDYIANIADDKLQDHYNDYDHD